MFILSAFADEISADPQEQIDVLKQCGVRHIELRSILKTNVLDLTNLQVKELKSLLDREGFRLSAIGSPIGKVKIDQPFAPHMQRFERAIDRAHEFGTPNVRIFSYYPPGDGGDMQPHRDEVLRRLAALAARTAGRDVVLLHENEKQIYGDIPRRCVDIVESVGSAVLRLAWDAANYVQCGVRPFSEAYAGVRPHLEYIQVKDALLSTGEVVPAGEGDGETVETVRALRDDGFDGYFSLEPHLMTAGALGGFSGEGLFAKAHRAFTDILRTEGIEYR